MFIVVVANISPNNKNTYKRILCGFCCCSQHFTQQTNKKNCQRISHGFCHWCQHCTQHKKPVEGYHMVLVIVANIAPNKRDLSKDIVCFLSLLPTFHPTKETCSTVLRVFCCHAWNLKNKVADIFFLAVYTYAAICCRLQTNHPHFPSASRVFLEYGLWKVSSSRLVTMVTTDLNILSTTEGHPTRTKLCHKQIHISKLFLNNANPFSSTVKSTKSIPALL